MEQDFFENCCNMSNAAVGTAGSNDKNPSQRQADESALPRGVMRGAQGVFASAGFHEPAVLRAEQKGFFASHADRIADTHTADF